MEEPLDGREGDNSDAEMEDGGDQPGGGSPHSSGEGSFDEGGSLREEGSFESDLLDAEYSESLGEESLTGETGETGEVGANASGTPSSGEAGAPPGEQGSSSISGAPPDATSDAGQGEATGEAREEPGAAASSSSHASAAAEQPAFRRVLATGEQAASRRNSLFPPPPPSGDKTRSADEAGGDATNGSSDEAEPVKRGRRGSFAEAMQVGVKYRGRREEDGGAASRRGRQGWGPSFVHGEAALNPLPLVIPQAEEEARMEAEMQRETAAEQEAQMEAEMQRTTAAEEEARMEAEMQRETAARKVKEAQDKAREDAEMKEVGALEEEDKMRRQEQAAKRARAQAAECVRAAEVAVEYLISTLENNEAKRIRDAEEKRSAIEETMELLVDRAAAGGTIAEAMERVVGFIEVAAVRVQNAGRGRNARALLLIGFRARTIQCWMARKEKWAIIDKYHLAVRCWMARKEKRAIIDKYHQLMIYWHGEAKKRGIVEKYHKVMIYWHGEAKMDITACKLEGALRLQGAMRYLIARRFLERMSFVRNAPEILSEYISGFVSDTLTKAENLSEYISLFVSDALTKAGNRAEPKRFRYENAACLQRSWRANLARKRFVHKKSLWTNAFAFQTRQNALLALMEARAVIFEQLDRRVIRADLTRLEAFHTNLYRGYLAKVRVWYDYNTPKQQACALKLQKCYRGMLGRDIARWRREERDEEIVSVTFIQGNMRMWLARRAVEMRRLDLSWPPGFTTCTSAVQVLQRVFRGHEARDVIRCIFLTRAVMAHSLSLEGAIRLQHSWRCHLARRRWDRQKQNSYALILGRLKRKARQGESLSSSRDLSKADSGDDIFRVTSSGDKRILRASSAAVVEVDDKYLRLQGPIVAFLEGESSRERKVRSRAATLFQAI
ncbi:hypothetical protein T484DRAFT_1851308, partial [Baffinella frigidus]